MLTSYGRMPRTAKDRARSTAVVRSLHTGEVTGSIPVAPTIKPLIYNGFFIRYFLDLIKNP